MEVSRQSFPCWYMLKLRLEHWTLNKRRESLLIIILLLLIISLRIFFQVEERDNNNNSNNSETGMFIQQRNKHDRFWSQLEWKQACWLKQAQIRTSYLVKYCVTSALMLSPWTSEKVFLIVSSPANKNYSNSNARSHSLLVYSFLLETCEFWVQAGPKCCMSCDTHKQI